MEQSPSTHDKFVTFKYDIVHNKYKSFFGWTATYTNTRVSVQLNGGPFSNITDCLDDIDSTAFSYSNLSTVKLPLVISFGRLCQGSGIYEDNAFRDYGDFHFDEDNEEQDEDEDNWDEDENLIPLIDI